MKTGLLPFKTFLLALGFGAITLLQGCGGGTTSTAPAPTPGPNDLVAGLSMSPSPLTVKSDNSDRSAITVVALDASNAKVSGATITFSASTGSLSRSVVTTDTNGEAVVDFSAGGIDKTNRTATVSATVNGQSAQAPIVIDGSTLSAAATTLNIPDDRSAPSTVTVTAQDAGLRPISGATIGFSPSGGGSVTVTPASTTTDSNGKVTATVTGTVAGSVRLTITGAGVTRTLDFTVSPTATAFKFDAINGNPVPADHIVATTIGTNIVLRANAPSSTSVTFASTSGVFNGVGAAVTVLAVGGKATATLNVASAGIANVQVVDTSDATKSDTLTVAATAAASSATKVTVQASPTVVQRTVGTTTGTATIVARVVTAADAPVGGVAVAFEIVNPTGGGETVSPVVQLTASAPGGGLSLGEAKATFTAGSVPSGALGVKVRARVVGTTIATGTTTEPDATLIIGGSAGSVSIGLPSGFTEDTTLTQYIVPMSIFVTDANGTGVATTVSLSLWPIAWNNGGPCTIPDDDLAARTGTFYNEDFDEDLIKDPGEDGRRVFYADPAGILLGADVGPANASDQDGVLTPSQADAGSIPATVTTDNNGIATFTYRYPKTSAKHVLSRIRASTVVQGTEAVGEYKFLLPTLLKDDDDDCFLPASRYRF